MRSPPLLPLLPPVLLLLLLLAPGLLAGGRRSKRHHCSDEDPVCQSDRFDVVFSHYDEHTDCKVYKCKCRIPDVITCPQGNPQQKTDSHGCQYYECVSCPVQQQVCQGTRISVYKGDDANGCPLRACECPPNPNRPQCNSNEQLQQLVDDSGCAYYQCRQVRSQCPEKPSCSANQELVSAGRVNDCDIYKCECLTPKKPACGIGSQPRLQDDGLGCQEYRCVENRSPCPPEPQCPSPHQVVAQDGVDENNCVKYLCKCIPLAPITCPDGYIMELKTDDACGCQYYKCEPNCQTKPNCPSVYEHAVVMATLSNGCPSYNCVCREPEVISCADENAHLALVTATDGSNCQTYVCRTDTDSKNGCVPPRCGNPIGTGQDDANGCPIYRCGGSRSGSCTIPTCAVGQTPVQVGFINRNCPHYECQSTLCQQPSSCSINQVATVRTGLQGCLVVTCTHNGNNRNGGGGVCGQPPVCSNGLQPQSIGVDSLGCATYACTRSGCPLPAIVCGLNQEPIVSGYDARNCPTYTCSSRRSSNCPSNPVCSQGESLYYTGEDSLGCAEYVCYRAGCPTPPTCTVGEVLQDLGLSTGSTGCRSYVCRSTSATCAARPNCGLGQTADVIGYDSVTGCPRYSCPGGTRSGGVVTTTTTGGGSYCAPAPYCGQGQTPVSYGLDGLGCELYICQGGVNSRSGGTVVNGGWSTVVNGVRNAGLLSTVTCPPQPECQYQQFRVRDVQQLGNGQVCTVYSCTNLGSYIGRPRKCLDNPSYCDSTQTVETYKKKMGKYKWCQKIACKGASNAAYY